MAASSDAQRRAHKMEITRADPGYQDTEYSADVASRGGPRGYTVRRRGPSLKTRRRFWIFGQRRRIPYRLQWELLRDGKPIGFYPTKEAAIAASTIPEVI